MLRIPSFSLRLQASTALWSAALLSMPTVAFAQQATTDMQEVIITAPAIRSVIQQTPSEARTEIEKTPGGVDLVGAEEYRDGKANTLKDVLDFVPGVFIQPKWGEDSKFSIRGSGLSRSAHMRGIKLMQDGVPLNLADGFADFQQIDPLTSSHTQVWKGGNALQYGAAYLGGAVNMVSQTGHTASLAQGRVEFGSFGHLRTQLSSGMVAGPWDYYVSPTRWQAHGYRDHTETDSNRITANVGHRFESGAETRLYLNLNDIRQELASSLTMDQFRNDPRYAGSAAGYSNVPKRDVQSVRVANKTAFSLDDWQMEGGLYTALKELYHPLSVTVVDQVSQDLGGYVRGVRDMTLFGHKNQVTLGLNPSWGHVDAKTYGTYFGNRGALTSEADQEAWNVETYGENRFFVTSDLSLIAAAQLFYSQRNATDRYTVNGNNSGSKDYAGINPKLGVLWEFRPGWQVFTNVSRAMEPPTLTDLNPSAYTNSFAPLKAQDAWTWELGTRGRQDGFEWDATLYHARIKNELQQFIDTGGTSFTRNAARTIHEGVELGLTLPILQGGMLTDSPEETVKWRLSYALNHFTFDEDDTYASNDLPGAPPHYIRSEVRYSHPVGLYLAPNLEWVPRGYSIDNRNTVKTLPYHLWGVKAGWNANEHLSIFLDGRNLADKSYISSASVVPVASTTTAAFSPGDGRAFFFGMDVKW